MPFWRVAEIYSGWLHINTEDLLGKKRLKIGNKSGARKPGIRHCKTRISRPRGEKMDGRLVCWETTFPSTCPSSDGRAGGKGSVRISTNRRRYGGWLFSSSSSELGRSSYIFFICLPSCLPSFVRPFVLSLSLIFLRTCIPGIVINAHISSKTILSLIPPYAILSVPDLTLPVSTRPKPNDHRAPTRPQTPKTHSAPPMELFRAWEVRCK